MNDATHIPHDTITPPSHYIPIQAARILDMPKSTVHYQMRPGGPLQAETWAGVRMIPAHRVLAAQAKREGVEP